MSVTICTGFSPAGYLEYGQKFMETFDRFWPQEIGLQVYVEEQTRVPRKGYRSLWDCNGVREFIDRHGPDATKNGRAPVEGWKPKDFETNYAYRWDAVKFCRQCFIPEQASRELREGDILVWLDGDVVTFGPPPDKFVEKTLANMDLCYLGRVNFHTELGFWAIRMNRQGRRFVATLANLYRSDAIFKLKEWHSAYAFDQVRKMVLLNARNLTPDGRGHVWFQHEISKFTDHLKGDKRKQLGRSLERSRS